jgi:hypothetical protein
VEHVKVLDDGSLDVQTLGLDHELGCAMDDPSWLEQHRPKKVGNGCWSVISTSEARVFTEPDCRLMAGVSPAGYEAGLVLYRMPVDQYERIKTHY